MNSERTFVGIIVLSLATLSWSLTILNVGPVVGMPTLPIATFDVLLFLVVWTVGMIAMMFPTSVPMLLMYLHVGKSSTGEVRAGGGPTPTKALIFVGTYISLWVGMGLLFYVAMAYILAFLPTDASIFVGSSLGLGLGLILVAAYQLSPIKSTCLSRCHPSSFLFQHYKGGVSGSALMGVDYAKYCIGCCWVMMAFLMVSASMGIGWMAAFAGIIFVERAFPIKNWMPRLFGLGFLAAGAAMVLVG